MFRYSIMRRAYWRLKGFPAQRVLRLLEESQGWPPPRLEAFRDEKLRALVAHCYAHVPYYRAVMDDRGLKPSDFATAADLPKLPVLTRDLVRANRERLWADNVPASQTYEGRTGGTTGEPMRIRRWPPDIAWPTQCYVRGLSWGGLWPDMPRISLFGGSLGQRPEGSWLKRLAGRFDQRIIFLPAFELSPQNVSQYVARIGQGGARHLIGYASAAYLLAIYAEQAGLRADLETVFTTAELLPDAWRDKIASVFSCRVLPYYGCGEVNSLGYQCGQGEGYHTCDEHAVLEVERPDGSTALDGEGAFLVTDLDNHAMPILRYRNGDGGVLAPAGCSCGRGLGRILRLNGRVNDFLVAEDGTRISGAIAAHSFRNVRGATFYQFVQDQPGRLLIRIVLSPQYDRSAEEKRLTDIFRSHLGGSAEITFEYPERLERTAAGKARFVISRIAPATPSAERTV